MQDCVTSPKNVCVEGYSCSIQSRSQSPRVLVLTRSTWVLVTRLCSILFLPPYSPGSVLFFCSFYSCTLAGLEPLTFRTTLACQLCNIFFSCLQQCKNFFLFHLCCMQFFSSNKRLQEFFLQNHPTLPPPSQELNDRPLRKVNLSQLLQITLCPNAWQSEIFTEFPLKDSFKLLDGI